ncbi:MAG: hypothetical protein JSU58_10350, partial [Dehalococcoidales bacterium]
MAKFVLPFPIKDRVDNLDELRNSEFYNKLPETFRDVADNNPHLLEYLYILPIAETGIPAFYPELAKNLADVKEPNVIYPVGNGIFTHILVDHKDSRNNYIQIEPTLIDDMYPLVQIVENACIKFADKLPTFDIDSDREMQLLNYVDLVTTHDQVEITGKFDKYKRIFNSSNERIIKVPISRRELAKVKYMFIRDKVGLGVLQSLINDPYIED